MSSIEYEGVGASLEEAIKDAHRQIPIPPHADITFSKVIDSGATYGGFIPQWSFWAKVIAVEAPITSPALLR